MVSFITRVQTKEWIVLIFGLLSFLSSIEGFCPSGCTCNNQYLKVECIEADMKDIPIQFNPSIRVMNLRRNQIDCVLHVFPFYNELTNLDISDNKLKSLGSRSFDDNKNLVYLNISRNSIESIEKRSFRGPNALITLDLSNNAISSIHAEAFNRLKNLRVLELSRNLIASLEKDLFNTLVNLEKLTLDHNKLIQIPSENLKYTKNLIQLSLSSNKIEEIRDSAVKNLRILEKLELNDNVISNIHVNAFDGLFSLEDLNLNQNRIPTLPTDSFFKLYNLLNLSLSENPIDSIPPNAFQGVPNLIHLQLNGLRYMTDIDSSAFAYNIKLEKIWMDHNIKIKTIPVKLFGGKPSLTHVSIRNNSLITLQQTHFPLSRLQSLQIGGNPLHCNCNLLWLWNLGNTKSSYFVDVQDVRCATPKQFENTLLIDVPRSNVECPSPKLIDTITKVPWYVWLSVIL